MKLLVVFMVLCIATTFAVPINGRPEIVKLIRPSEISLRLEPPVLPRDQSHHHHHHNNNHQAQTTRSPATRAPVTTRAPMTTKVPSQHAVNLPAMSSSDIVLYEFKNFPDGGYSFKYETSDGQKRNEVGSFREDETLGRILNVRGSYEYIDTDGQLVIVKYEADENGYREEKGVSHSSGPLAPQVIATLSG